MPRPTPTKQHGGQRPNSGRKPTPSKAASDAARALQALRKTRAGGRPQTDAPRCPCGIMTLKRAEARGKSSEHEPECAFYRPRAVCKSCGASSEIASSGRPGITKYKPCGTCGKVGVKILGKSPVSLGSVTPESCNPKP